MKKILLDTDIGTDIDDAFALPYLLNSDKCEILGITTVSSNTRRRCEIADALCKEKNVNIPIFAGSPWAMNGTDTRNPVTHREFAPDYTNEANFGDGCFDAVNFLKEKIYENPNEITLVTIGPLTNVAILFSVYPETQYMLKELAIMGGYYFKNPICEAIFKEEWNIKCDPFAAKIVLESNCKKIIAVGADVTFNFGLKTQEAANLISDIPYMKPLFDYASNHWHSEKIYFHDPLLCMLALYPELGEFKKGKVEVETEDKDCIAKTVFTADEEGNFYLCTGLKGGIPAFYDNYIAELK